MKLSLNDWNSFTYICNTDIINITRILQNQKGTSEQANKVVEAAKH